MQAPSIFHIAAFSEGQQGGNPAGVYIGDTLPTSQEMQAIAKEVGYSETVFACRQGDDWRVRYFSPESEVPFCGHATIALGAVLAQEFGENPYQLHLQQGQIRVEGKAHQGTIHASLQSPPTKSAAPNPEMLPAALDLFGLIPEQIDARIPPALMHGGADHLLLCLTSRQALTDMHYELDRGREFMLQHGLVTIMLAYAETSQLFHSRNAFASGGVYEDPATGAASAAFAGYLRDLNWPHQGEITLIQGEDMGMRSVIHAAITAEKGASIKIFGAARVLK